MKGEGRQRPPLLHGRYESRSIGAEPDALTGVWVPNSSQDPFGRTRARQEDRDQAALFTARYGEALEKLRAKQFRPKDKGVPLEWFEWERLIIDECHESLVMGEEDAEARASVLGSESRGQKEKRKCAQRELLGIGEPDPSKRPMRARRSTWGLTGTPLLSSETRITELAALCGGAYVCGGAAHWRTMVISADLHRPLLESPPISVGHAAPTSADLRRSLCACGCALFLSSPWP